MSCLAFSFISKQLLF